MSSVNILARYPELEVCFDQIEKARELLVDTYKADGKVMVCGNGGSCADCEHIVGELMKGFLKSRPLGNEIKNKLEDIGFDDAEFICSNLQGALGAISLPSQAAILSAFANDVNPDMVYAQMLYGYGRQNDCLICLSTSGNSKNVVYAAILAKALGIKTLAMTGEKESELSKICDVCIRVPSCETYKVQEYHLPVYHYLCAEIEDEFFCR